MDKFPFCVYLLDYSSSKVGISYYGQISFLDLGMDDMYGRIIALDQVYGKAQVEEKSFRSVVVMMIRLLLIHL